MTQGKKFRNLILELLSDGETHSTKEIRNYIVEHNIKLTEDSTRIRNILFAMKKENTNFINVKRGLYCLQSTNNEEQEIFSELNNAISIIKTTINECKSFNWYQCNDQQLNIARSKIKMIINLADIIDSELSL